MRCKKVSKKCKTIWTVIDVLLLIPLALAVCACWMFTNRLAELPGEEALKTQMEECSDRITQLEQRIEDRKAQIAREEAENLAQIPLAQEELALAQSEYDQVLARHTEVDAQLQRLDNTDKVAQQYRDDIARIRTEYGQACRALEDKILAGESDYRICYLTFDDGPSYITEEFLDKIDTLDIRVTFFTIGVQMPQRSYGYRNQLLLREAQSGHAIANHSYTHAFDGSLYQSLENFVDAVQKQQDLVYDVTGIRTDVFRFPAGSYYCRFRTKAIEALEEMDYGYIDWIGNAFDSGNKVRSSSAVASIVVGQARQDLVTVILMHDWRRETLGALETIVTTLKKENYLFLPLFKESSTVGNAVPKWDN